MSRLTLQEGRPRPEYEKLADGSIHAARVTLYKIGPARWTDPDGTVPDIITINFALLDERHDGRIIKGETRVEFHADPSCQLYGWVLAIMNVPELPPGFDLDLDTMIVNKPCRVAVNYEEWDSKKNFEADGTPKREWANKVVDVLPPKASQAATPQVNVAARPATSTV